MKTSPSPLRAAGFTLVEMMVAVAIVAVAMAMALSGTVFLQRSFWSAEFHSSAQNDQLRLSDYLSRDLRMATAVTITRGGQQIDLRLPAQNASLVQVHLNVPVLSNLLGVLAPPPDRQVRYTLSGTDICREENGARVTIAQNVSDFLVARTGSTVSITSSFRPRLATQYTRATTDFTSLRQSVSVRYAVQ